MKRPEYTAIVTGICAGLLRERRGPMPGERYPTAGVFARWLYRRVLYRQKGRRMFGTKTDGAAAGGSVPVRRGARAFAEGKEAPLVPVSLCFTARVDTGAVLSADGFPPRRRPSGRSTVRPRRRWWKSPCGKPAGRRFGSKTCASSWRTGYRAGVRDERMRRATRLRCCFPAAVPPPAHDRLEGALLRRDEECASREGFRGYRVRAPRRRRRRPRPWTGNRLRAGRRGGRHCLPAVLPRVFWTRSSPNWRCCSARR